MTIALQKTFWISNEVLSIFTIVNLIIIAFTNGYVTSTIFSLGPKNVPEELQGRAGASINLFLITGILTGSTFATLVMQKLVA